VTRDAGATWSVVFNVSSQFYFNGIDWCVRAVPLALR
jgi:hypothetical protein